MVDKRRLYKGGIGISLPKQRVVYHNKERQVVVCAVPDEYRARFGGFFEDYITFHATSTKPLRFMPGISSDVRSL
jgi:hypothetical protein